MGISCALRNVVLSTYAPAISARKKLREMAMMSESLRVVERPAMIVRALAGRTNNRQCCEQ